MVCLYCQSKLSVSNSRPQKRTNTVWRRRACPSCHAVFTSVESIDPTVSVVFEGPQKQLEPFSQDKLYISVYEACRHRKSAAADARGLTDTIIADLLRDAPAATLQRRQVITATTEVLQRFDPVAATAYSAYHPR